MTTTNIEFAANMAELAEASYALFNLNDPSTALINSGFSVTQAAEFVTNWEKGTDLFFSSENKSVPFSSPFGYKENGKQSLLISYGNGDRIQTQLLQ